MNADERREAQPSEAAIEAGATGTWSMSSVVRKHRLGSDERIAAGVLHAARAAGAIRYDYEWDEAIALLVEQTCQNCDDRLCMSCVLRDQHDKCEDDCPHCCVASDDSYWQSRVDKQQRRRAFLASQEGNE